MEKVKGFIDFILRAQESKSLTQGFLEAETAKELNAFFSEEGYKGITLDECEKLLKAKKKLPPGIVDPHGMY